MHEASRATELIQLQNVCKYYPDGEVHALKDISLTISQGESVSIVGPSGCGKSTLLNIMGVLDKPTSGEVLFRGQSVLKSNLSRLRALEFGFVFQSFYLLPNLTALENVQLPMFEGTLTLSERVARAQELLDLVGLANRVNHLPNQLSIGQRQRVAIARALANGPSIVLADEPTGSLDSTSGSEVISLLLELNSKQKTTLVVVTHDLPLARKMSRVLEMRDGVVVSDSKQE